MSSNGVKNGKGEYLSFSSKGDSIWNENVGVFETSKHRAFARAQRYGGTAYPCAVFVAGVLGEEKDD